MTVKSSGIDRRQVIGSGIAGLVVLGAGGSTSVAQAALLRQGYQTNIWGMPTYYLMKSGLLEKAGVKFQEFAVASGNLTMQQQVARQVDLGTYAGQSFIIGHDKGQLIAIALIEHVGKTVRVMARKELNIKSIAELKGRKIANQTGSSIGNVFMDQIAPKAGLKKGDFQEVRMDVNNMVAAMAAKTVDAMVNVEPYNSIAEGDGIATTIMDYWDVDKMPVFMAATPDFVAKQPDMIVAYLKAWLEAGRHFRNDFAKVADVIHSYYTSRGYSMSKDAMAKALQKVDVNPGFPRDLEPYMREQAEILLREKKIAAIPNWKVALRPDFMEKALKG